MAASVNATFVSPTSIRVDASAACQLSCPLCPTGQNNHNIPTVGSGMLKFENFKKLIDRYPQIRQVELANSGEALLNKELPQILRYAYEHGVETILDKGVNLNHASDETLEALVKYQTLRVRCAIDGTTKETYAKYRIGGDLQQVLENVKKINAFKRQYQSTKPALIWQFVVFNHNEHQVEQVFVMAKMLRMKVHIRLNVNPDVMPVSDPEKLRKYTNYTSRHDYAEREGRDYCWNQCYHLFTDPQINWDGRLLGCGRNYWGSFADNVFEEDLMEAVNNEKMQYARQMIMGQQPAREDIPCAQCQSYLTMQKSGNWIRLEEVSLAEEPM